MPSIDIDKGVRQAVRHFWRTRNQQSLRQVERGSRDHGTRGSVTGGKQMDGFVNLFIDAISDAGVPEACIFKSSKLELPGYFRPTKEWDLLVVMKDRLVLALEAKSQVGPSFGNNFNNRTEEAMGSALDLWTAFREKAFGAAAPWLGYLFLLEDCQTSRRPVRVHEPHFEVFPEYKKASYAMRYELFCRKLVLERHYNASTLLLSPNALRGKYVEPADDLRVDSFVKSMVAHVRQFVT
jgi:hypothetical protein